MTARPRSQADAAAKDGVRAVFIGVIARDVIVLVDDFPRPDQRVEALQIVHGVGGTAATAAVACARQGVPVALCGAVGDDAEGEAVCRALAAEGVDIAGVARVRDGATSQSVIVVDRRQKTRAICNRAGPALEPPLLANEKRLARGVQWIHVDRHGWPWAARAKRALPKARVSVDEGNVIDSLDLASVDLYVPTLSVLGQRFGSDNVERLLAAARRAGAGEVVATAGGDGAYGLDADGTPYRCGAFTDTDIVSTLGAGDVFHGALIAARVQGQTAEPALAYASMAAALSCCALDGQSAIPRPADINARLAAVSKP